MVIGMLPPLNNLDSSESLLFREISKHVIFSGVMNYNNLEKASLDFFRNYNVSCDSDLIFERDGEDKKLYHLTSYEGLPIKDVKTVKEGIPPEYLPDRVADYPIIKLGDNKYMIHLSGD